MKSFPLGVKHSKGNGHNFGILSAFPDSISDQGKNLGMESIAFQSVLLGLG